MWRSPIARLDLVPSLRCPRCGRPYHGLDVEIGRVFPKCDGRHCGQRWWAMALSIGWVFPQLAEPFGEPIAGRLMLEHEIPARLEEPMFWQLPLTGTDFAHHRRAHPLALFRALRLVPLDGVA